MKYSNLVQCVCDAKQDCTLIEFLMTARTAREQEMQLQIEQIFFL